MKRITRGAVVLATFPLLLVGMAAAAVAGGSGITTTRPFSDGSWTPGVQQGSGVSTMRPFSDPNYPILAQSISRGMQPENPGGALPLVALAVGLTALAAAAAAWATIGPRKRLRAA